MWVGPLWTKLNEISINGIIFLRKLISSLKGVSYFSSLTKDKDCLKAHSVILHGSLNELNPDSKVRGANMEPTWVLSAPDKPDVGPLNLDFREYSREQ